MRPRSLEGQDHLNRGPFLGTHFIETGRARSDSSHTLKQTVSSCSELHTQQADPCPQEPKGKGFLHWVETWGVQQPAQHLYSGFRHCCPPGRVTRMGKTGSFRMGKTSSFMTVMFAFLPPSRKTPRVFWLLKSQN